MALSNAERQARWREKQKKIRGESKKVEIELSYAFLAAAEQRGRAANELATQVLEAFTRSGLRFTIARCLLGIKK